MSLDRHLYLMYLDACAGRPLSFSTWAEITESDSLSDLADAQEDAACIAGRIKDVIDHRLRALGHPYCELANRDVSILTNLNWEIVGDYLNVGSLVELDTPIHLTSHGGITVVYANGERAYVLDDSKQIHPANTTSI